MSDHQQDAERTDREYIARVIHASPFADNEAGIPQMVQLIKALETQRDAAKAELEAVKAQNLKMKQHNLLNAIGRICETCGHEKNEDGCACCITQSLIQLRADNARLTKQLQHCRFCDGTGHFTSCEDLLDCVWCKGTGAHNESAIMSEVHSFFKAKEDTARLTLENADLKLQLGTQTDIAAHLEYDFSKHKDAHDLAITTLESCLRDRTDGGLAIATALAALKGE